MCTVHQFFSKIFQKNLIKSRSWQYCSSLECLMCFASIWIREEMREQDKSPEPKYGPMGISEHNIIIIQLLASGASIQFLAKYWSSFAANPPDFRAGLGPCSKIDTLMMSQRIVRFFYKSPQRARGGVHKIPPAPNRNRNRKQAWTGSTSLCTMYHNFFFSSFCWKITLNDSSWKTTLAKIYFAVEL